MGVFVFLFVFFRACAQQLLVCEARRLCRCRQTIIYRQHVRTGHVARLLLYGETIQNVKILPAWLVGYAVAVAVAVAGLATKNLLLRFGL